MKAKQLSGLTNLVAFGDSITRGYAVKEEEGWVALLSGLIKKEPALNAMQVFNAGGNGNTSAEGLARIEADVLAHMPGLVLVEFGGNDTVHDTRAVSVDAFEENLLTIAGRIRTGGGEVVLVTFPPVINEWHATKSDIYYNPWGGLDQCVEQYRQRTREVSKRIGCPLFDLDAFLRGLIAAKNPETYINRDGVHLTPEANRLIAFEVVKFLKSVEEDKPTEFSVTSLAEAKRLYPAPGNKRAFLQQPCDNRIVVARPDLKFQVYNSLAAQFKTGFGFVLLVDGKPQSFDSGRVEQRFEAGALPVLSQQISQAGFRFVLESFTTRDVCGRGVIMLRLAVRCQKGGTGAVDLGFLMTRAGGGMFSTHPNDDYIPFESWGAAWEKPFPWNGNETNLNDGAFVMALCRHSPGVAVQAPGAGPGAVTWRFHVDGRNEEQHVIEVRVPYECRSKPVGPEDKALDFRADLAFSVAQQDELARLSFEAEKERQRQRWLAQLARGTRIEVPEQVVQETYQTLTLNNLQFLGGARDTAALRPGQGGYNDFSTVYAWEASHFLVQMARQGFHAELRNVLDYLLTTQKKAGELNGPEGDISDVDGCFRPHIHWMNETGAVLLVFAEYALASGDYERLRAVSQALLGAARWIQRQRNRTRDLLPGGGKALHYGLLPKGRPHDWPIHGHFLFSDTYTWSGLNRLAQAFSAAGLPDAGWLRGEADDYRSCILAAARGSLKPHPRDPSLKWVPCDIYEEPAAALRTTIFCGPNSLLGSGILDPDDELVERIEESLKAADCLNGEFAFRMRMMEDEGCRKRQLEAAGGHVDLYYVTFAEVPWHRVWLERGELEKAQAFFYMTLAYAVSRDLHVAQERYCPQLPWLLPWQPNASANGRILSMILACLCFVRVGVCNVLQGVTDDWFAKGAPLGVDGLWINGSRLSFRLTCGDRGSGWHFAYACEGPWVPELFRIALPVAGGGRVLRDFATQRRKTGSVDIQVESN